MKGTSFITFAVGLGIGSAATWYFLKTKYEKLAQEEIDSVKQAFSNKKETDKEPDPTQDVHAEFTKEKPNINEYAKKLSREGYTDYSKVSNESEKTPVNEVPETETIGVEKPYVISPDEFGEFYDYSKISLTYFSDHILTDENYEMVEDIDDVVGFESLNHFGEYEDDSVFVRNDRLKVDYEILLDQRKYTDVLKSKPYLAEVWDDDGER